MAFNLSLDLESYFCTFEIRPEPHELTTRFYDIQAHCCYTDRLTAGFKFTKLVKYPAVSRCRSISWPCLDL